MWTVRLAPPEIETGAENCADIGVDSVWVQNLSHDFGDASAESRYRRLQEYVGEEALFQPGDGRGAEAFDLAARRAREVGLPLRLPRLVQRPDRRGDHEPGCSWPWDSAYVTHRGEVQPCCMVMGSDRATLGNLQTERFPEIWRGEVYRDFRERLLGDDPPDVCRGCSLYRGLF